MTSSSSGSKPKNVRQGLSRYEPGAHLYAAFPQHWKAGVASMIPFAILFFTTQPFHQAMNAITAGGYTITPAIVAVTSVLWAVMSVAILHQLRFRDNNKLHFLVYGVAGALVLLVLAIAAITVVQGRETGIYDPSTSPVFLQMLIGAPLVGAAGSVIGRWTLNTSIYWHRWIVREPLPDVFKFVDGKRDKDDFKRL